MHLYRFIIFMKNLLPGTRNNIQIISEYLEISILSRFINIVIFIFGYFHDKCIYIQDNSLVNF
jgi:hypothetical protein